MDNTMSLALTGAGVDMRSSHYQELKSRIHQELLNRLNLDRLTRMRKEDAEPEIRNLIVGMVEREGASTPLSLFEREALISDVINELFGLGPLEALLRDPSVSDIRSEEHTSELQSQSNVVCGRLLEEKHA